MKGQTHSDIESTISKKKAGEIIFLTDFRGKGTHAAIKQAMSRLARKGKVKRLAHGIYYLPKTDPLLGEMRPDPDEVVNMLAKKEHIQIKPAGAYALHRLGLTTQVPTKRVYITNGNPRQFRLGRMQVSFKATSAKKLAMKGKTSALVIQAIEELGLDQIGPDIELKIRGLLLREDPRILRYDLTLASGKVNDYIVKLMKKIVN